MHPVEVRPLAVPRASAMKVSTGFAGVAYDNAPKDPDGRTPEEIAHRLATGDKVT